MAEQLKGWDIEGGGSSKVEFTKFSEGLTKIRLVDTVPHMRWIHWMSQHRKGVNCPGKGCPICEIRNQQKKNDETPTYNMAKRLSLQVINRNNGRLEMMEQGVTFFEDLKMVLLMAVEKNLDINGVDLMVRRKGTGKDDTTYRIDLGEEYPLTDEDKKLIEEKAVVLDEYFAENTVEQLTRLLNGEDWETVMTREESEEEEFELE